MYMYTNACIITNNHDLVKDRSRNRSMARDDQVQCHDDQ